MWGLLLKNVCVAYTDKNSFLTILLNVVIIGCFCLFLWGCYPSSTLSTCGLDGADFSPLLWGQAWNSDLPSEKHGFDLGMDMLGISVKILKTDNMSTLDYQITLPQTCWKTAMVDFCEPLTVEALVPP